MPDHPVAGGADTTVGPAPGYYADPSIPGFVRYWGGSAWVPGTSRPTPAEGEVLEPPRFLARPAAARPAGARPVPPPAGGGGVGATGGSAGVGGVGGAGAAETGTGPVYFDQTSAGTSFSMAPQAELELRRRAEVEARAQLQAQLPVQAQWGGPPFSAPLPAHGGSPAPRPVPSTGALGVSPGSALQQYADLLADPPAPVGSVGSDGSGAEQQAPGSGWQADPRAQRGLMETGGSPRWVSWGVLRGAGEAEAVQEDSLTPPAVRAETEAPAAVLPAVLPVVTAGQEVGEQEIAEQEVGEPVPLRTAPALVRPAAVAVPAPVPVPARAASARAASAPAPAPGPSGTPAPAPAPTGRPAAGRRVPPRPAAGLGRRLAARVVDTVVMAVVAVAAGLPLASSAVAHIDRKLALATVAGNLAGRQVQVWLVDGVVLGKAAALFGILLLAGFLYEVLPTARTGQTFGKRLLGIRVVDARTAPRVATRTASRASVGRTASRTAGHPVAPKPPTVGRSFTRWIVRQLATVLVIGLCWPLLDRPGRRGWQDRAARTRVVKA